MALWWWIEFATIVLMHSDYATSSGNLGERTYEEGKAYQVDPHMLKELAESGCGEQVTKERFRSIGGDGYTSPPEGIPVRPLVGVVPKVTKMLAASAENVFHLKVGEAIEVPSNLAAYLLTTEQATAV